jgi:cyclic beta-1,2-glucan synthetase
VRENGGQYSHAGVWALMAQAELAKRADAPPDARDLAYRYFTYLSPAHRASDPTRGAVYGIEPYAMAGDVYSHPPYVGRGGWSWYTGAAAWMHRAAVESIFGLTQTSRELFLRPCLPTHWPRAELTLQRDGRSMRFILIRMDEVAALAATAADEARLLQHGRPVAWTELPSHSCFVLPIG